jgi:RNA polymerase-binding protein DksA
LCRNNQKAATIDGLLFICDLRATSEGAGSISEMDKKELDQYKWALLKKRGELSANTPVIKNPIPASGSWQGDEIDQATADIDAELQIRLDQTDDLLRAVEGALARIRLGTFGICEVCNRPVSRARLESVPWTRLCRDCKEHQGE